MTKKKMTKQELSDKIQTISESHIESNHEMGSAWQQKHARLVERYLVTYPNSMLTDDETAALIFALNTDLQVRDYAMGLNRASDKHYQAWYTLMNRAPLNYKSAQACLASQVRYEQGITPEAIMLLTHADTQYALTQLLKRVYEAGWNPTSFADMRAQLHPKVVEGIFQLHPKMAASSAYNGGTE
jgi:hypothetical protein